jgi:hypothetical protein
MEWWGIYHLSGVQFAIASFASGSTSLPEGDTIIQKFAAISIYLNYVK